MKIQDSQPRSRWWKRGLIALVIGASIGAGTTAAYAGTASSAVGASTFGGNQYQNRATVSTSSNSAQASTFTDFRNGQAPSGWVGARGRLFTSGGALSCEGTTAYNSSAGLPAIAGSCTRSYAGTWYSYGVSYSWNGSSYNSWYTFKSPNQTS